MSSRAPILDAGWFFLIAGLGLIGSTVLIPAADDVEEARWLRDRAVAVEQHRMDRIARYEQFLGAMDEKDANLLTSLAASQLHKIPASLAVFPADAEENRGASVFPGLEPPPLVLPERQKFESALGRLAMHNTYRLIMMAGGAFCMLLGILPTTKPSRGRTTGGGKAEADRDDESDDATDQSASRSNQQSMAAMSDAPSQGGMGGAVEPQPA